MPDRYKHRFDLTSGPNNGTNGFAAIFQMGIAALFGTRSLIPARQSGLGTADGRFVKKHTDMTGKAATSGVRDALPIENQQVRRNS